MLALFGVSAYFYFYKRNEWKRTNSVLKRAAERWGSIGMWLAGLSLLFVIFRLIPLDFFNIRLWLYLAFLTALAVGGWFYYWYRTTYPKQLARFQKQQRARQYMPGAAKKGSAKAAPAAVATSTSTATTTTTTTGANPAQPAAATQPPRPSGSQAARKKRKRR
jgi:hypothetical protein